MTNELNTEKTSRYRTKRVVIPALATVAMLAVGGTVWAATASDGVGGSERDRVAAAAVRVAGGGTATDVETSDDPGEAYEVDVRRGDGSEVEVTLDKDLKVLHQEHDDDADDSRVGDDSTDRVPTPAERASASRAAMAAVGGGTVVKVETSDDGPETYEVTVLDEAKKVWDVELDAGFKVLSRKLDD